MSVYPFKVRHQMSMTVATHNESRRDLTRLPSVPNNLHSRTLLVCWLSSVEALVRCYVLHYHDYRAGTPATRSAWFNLQSNSECRRSGFLLARYCNSARILHSKTSAMVRTRQVRTRQTLSSFRPTKVGEIKQRPCGSLCSPSFLWQNKDESPIYRVYKNSLLYLYIQLIVYSNYLENKYWSIFIKLYYILRISTFYRNYYNLISITL